MFCQSRGEYKSSEGYLCRKNTYPNWVTTKNNQYSQLQDAKNVEFVRLEAPYSYLSLIFQNKLAVGGKLKNPEGKKEKIVHYCQSWRQGKGLLWLAWLLFLLIAIEKSS